MIGHLIVSKKESNSPGVSVIIPIYKVEEFIHECVESVLSQTYKDFEIILVDDGSTDSCGEICDDFSKSDNRIKVIHKQNGGLSDARNVGLSLARAEYIYFLDSDDWIENNLIECVLEKMEKGYDMVVFNYYTVFPDFISKKTNHVLGEFTLNNDRERLEFYFSIFLKAIIGWSAWDRIFRKSLIDKYKLSFADNKKIFLEDLYFSSCYCAFTQKILSIKDRLFYYRQREDSIIHTDGLEMNFNRINELGKELFRYYTCMNCSSLLNVFSQIYFKIFYNLLTSTQKVHEVGLRGTRELILNDIQDQEFFLKQMKDLLSQHCVSTKLEEEKNLSEMKNYARFFINGNVLEFKVRNRINSLMHL